MIRSSSWTRITITASLVLLMAGCSGNADFDRRINSADENYMSELAGQLDAAGIDFRVGRDGSITYRSRDEKSVTSIDERVKKQLAASGTKKSTK